MAEDHRSKGELLEYGRRRAGAHPTPAKGRERGEQGGDGTEREDEARVGVTGGAGLGDCHRWPPPSRVGVEGFGGGAAWSPPRHLERSDARAYRCLLIDIIYNKFSKNKDAHKGKTSARCVVFH